ncbi:hypothetical protein ACFLSU_07120 [Bacteroidota bacterium]
MKKIAILFFCVLTYFCDAQNNSSLELSLSGGISSPSSSFSDDSFASNGSFLELSSAYYFSKFGIGVSLGQFSNPTKDNFSEFTDQLGYPVSNSFEDWKTSFYGIGPNVNLDLGNIEATIFARYGQLSTKAISIEGSYENNNADISTTVPVYNLNVPNKNTSGYYSTGVKLGYKINSNFSFYVTSNFMSSSDEISIEKRSAKFQDLDGDGTITEQEIQKLIGRQVEYKTSSTHSKLNTFNYGFGLAYKIQTKKAVRRPMQDVQKPDKVVMQKDNPPIKVAFTNPIKEQKKQQRKIVLITPKNNSSFENSKEIKTFTWRTVGERIMQPKYGVTVERVSFNRRDVLKTYFETGNRPTMNVDKIFKNEPESGTYKWKVTELTTGTTSNYNFFNFTNCDIDFSISNEEIECLGYEGEDRKYKICFDATYVSPSGDLTYVNASSGLSVYDQTYATLSYTMVSPNPTLVTQVGATSSTVSYCFEVTVSNSVTSIGFGLQGDDLDPSPITCQPGISLIIDELPDCICDECEDIELSFDNFTISPNGTSGNQFNFDGDINVNVPIYGIEFQIQEYTYSASPSACSEGVSNLEESGMILMPGTTINGSTSLELSNETISGSALSNDSATKNIKYSSGSAMSGSIPVNLTIGLPGPISGLDPSCCTLSYTVCIRVKVFYEESNCKSCVFTHCFNFNNQ